MKHLQEPGIVPGAVSVRTSQVPALLYFTASCGGGVPEFQSCRV